MTSPYDPSFSYHEIAKNREDYSLRTKNSHDIQSTEKNQNLANPQIISQNENLKYQQPAENLSSIYDSHVKAKLAA